MGFNFFMIRLFLFVTKVIKIILNKKVELIISPGVRVFKQKLANKMPQMIRDMCN